jgi:hypothetical protein
MVLLNILKIDILSYMLQISFIVAIIRLNNTFLNYIIVNHFIIHISIISQVKTYLKINKEVINNVTKLKDIIQSKLS